VAEALELHILTPLGPKRERLRVEGVQLPAMLGEIGVLPDHEALVTVLMPGVVRFRESGKDIRIAVKSGVVEITTEGRALVLTEEAVESHEVDAPPLREKLRTVSAELDAQRDSVETAEYRALADERAWLEAQLRAAGERLEAGKGA
jgi:F-type H+-transporting ATPase subunit epsilon